MPITPISKKVRQGTLGSYYACSSYTAINPEFGTLDDLKTLVKEAHALGLKLIIDWVANHTGWDHEWTVSHSEWYIKDKEGNFTDVYGWHDVIDLDYTNNSMREAMIAAMQFWIKECDIDGFRCDMAHLVPLDSWAEARKRCDSMKPLFWLAECEEVNYHEVFDVTYAWAFMHSSDDYTKGKASLNDLRNVLHGYSQYAPGAGKLLFTSNHDENSWNGTEYEKYGESAKTWAVFTCTWNGMPLVYSGQESPNRKRLLFFEKDLIEWHEPLQLQSFYTILLQLHKTPAIAIGETFILPSDNPHVMIYLRRKDNNVVLVILNLSGDERVKCTVTHEWLPGIYRNVFSGLDYTFTSKEDFELEAYDYLVYEK
ncbi:glycoside hydrolase superfamily [Russula earlei]|uniref:Glycoside hydrolase superfamily n=1 Tax=Russula earlei TaxID=71964 RepID=A0ACC0TUD7_9AGAM|nr:glycoside hydrolase superfamily [Russula earlei]